MRGRIDQLRTECSKLKARKESLEEVLAHRSYTTESVKRLFAALEKGKAQDLRPQGVLADFVEVDPQFEKPAEEFLHDELEYVVVENWAQADRGLDFLRAELDGRATFLVHPEKNGNGHGHLPEPAIGPETGILSRLSDSLRLTNGLTDRAATLLPRVSLCFVAEDRASAQRLATSYPHLYFLTTDGLCYHGHTVTGGKKTASGPLAMKREARELGVVLAGKQKALDEQVARLEELDREIGILEAELERLRGVQQAREKDRVALEHEMRKLADDTNRANSRLSVARLELDRLKRDAERSPGAARAQSAGGRGKGRTARAARTGAGRPAPVPGEAGSRSRGARRRSFGAARGTGRPRRAASRRARRHGPAGSATQGSHVAAAGRLPPKSSAWACIARGLLADNIELDRSWRRWRSRPCEPKPRSTNWPPRKLACARRWPPTEEELKRLRMKVEEAHTKPLPDRSRSGAAPGRAEVSGRDQPQGIELRGGGAGGRRRDGAGQRSDRRSRAALRGSARAHRSAGSGERAGHGGVSGSLSSARNS